MLFQSHFIARIDDVYKSKKEWSRLIQLVTGDLVSSLDCHGVRMYMRQEILHTSLYLGVVIGDYADEFFPGW